MAQLAGSELTRQAIFLIETGRTRPSAGTLDLIAAKTGKPTSYFKRPGAETARWSGRNHTEQLQALCLQQRFDEAVELGLRMLEETMPPSVEAQVRQYVGQALVRSSRPDAALEHLRKARTILESEPDPWLAVECADWEASALYLKEDRRALPLAEHALKLCRSTEPRLPGTEARILEHVASIHVKNHNYEKAVAYYEEALQVAGSVRELSRLARTYHGLSIAYQERGDLERAIEFTHKALALYGLEHDNALLARGENELGLLLMRQGLTERAEEAFRAALDHFDHSGTESAKSHVLLSLGELRWKAGRLDEAVATTQQAIDLARRLDEKLAVSTGHQLLGRLYDALGKHRLADREFGAGIKLLRDEGLSHRLAESHAAYAEVLESRGRSTLAGKHWREAAHLALDREKSGERQSPRVAAKR